MSVDDHANYQALSNNVKENVMIMTANQIREARIAAGISQRQLASLLKVHPNNLCRFELGKSQSYRLQVKATEYFHHTKSFRGLSC